MSPSPESKSTRALLEFMAVVSSCSNERDATEHAVRRAAKAVNADVGALLRVGTVTACVGLPSGHQSRRELERALRRHLGTVELPPLGPLSLAFVTLDGDPATALVVARRARFLIEETELLRGMGRVLAMALRTLRWGQEWPPAPKPNVEPPPGPVKTLRATAYTLQVSQNRRSWVTVASVTGVRKGTTDVLRFPAVHARFVRVRITAGIVLNTITVGTKKEVQKLPPLLQELTLSR